MNSHFVVIIPSKKKSKVMSILPDKSNDLVKVSMISIAENCSVTIQEITFKNKRAVHSNRTTDPRRK